MTDWVKFADSWIGSPDVEALGAEAIVLHQSAISLVSRNRTDGWLAEQVMRHLFPVTDVLAEIAVLVDADLWERRDGGFFLLTWEKHLLSSDELKRRADASVETSKRSRLHKAGNHSMCDWCSVVKARDASRDASLITSVTDPVSLLSDSSRIASSRNEVERRSEERREGGSDSKNGAAPRADSSSPSPGPWSAGMPAGFVPPGLPPGVIPSVAPAPVEVVQAKA